MDDHLRYNELPTIDEANERANQHPDALPALIDVINSYNVQDIFGIRLLHRHFALEPNEIALFQKMTDVHDHDVLVLSPQLPDGEPPRQPINFHLHEGTLVPYEYTTEPSRANYPDLADFSEFVQAYELALVNQGVESIYGLDILPADEWEDTQELLIHGQRVTITVPTSMVDPEEGVPLAASIWKSGQESGVDQEVARTPVAVPPGCALTGGPGAHCIGCFCDCVTALARQGEDSSCNCSCAKKNCGCECKPGQACECTVDRCKCPPPPKSVIYEIIAEILRRLGILASGEHKD